MKRYIITTYAQDGEKMGWANSDGWTDVKYAQEFTEEDIYIYNLPIDGTWEEITS